MTIPKHSDHRGTLSVVDWLESLSFIPRRFYYIYDVAIGTTRAGHAHFVEQEFILCLTGSVLVLTDNGKERQEFCLNRPDIGLYIPPMVWHELRDFSAGVVCAVLASERYSEKDYLRGHQEFLEAARQNLR